MRWVYFISIPPPSIRHILPCCVTKQFSCANIQEEDLNLTWIKAWTPQIKSTEKQSWGQTEIFIPLLMFIDSVPSEQMQQFLLVCFEGLILGQTNTDGQIEPNPRDFLSKHCDIRALKLCLGHAHHMLHWICHSSWRKQTGNITACFGEHQFYQVSSEMWIKKKSVSIKTYLL